MKKIVNRVIILILLLLIPSMGYAEGRFHVGANLIYSNINYPGAKFVSEYEDIKNPKQGFNSITVGYTTELDNKIVLDFTTNRLLNRYTSRSVTYNGTTLLAKAKLRTDIFQIGRRYDKLVPSVFIANTELNKWVYQDHVFLGRETNHTFLYGVNLNYFLHKDISSSIFYIFPNNEIGLESAIGLGINYYF